MNSGMAGEQFWAERSVYEEAEQKYYEKRIGPSMSSKVTLTPLADEVAKARQRLINIRDSFEISAEHLASDTCSMGSLEKKYLEFERVLNTIKDQITRLDERLRLVELRYTETKGDRTKPCAICVEKIETTTKTDDDDVDLFASDSDDDEADQLKQQRLADYHAKKSKKPVLIAKSSIVLDVKPWDDETDMKLMEENVRKIEMEGMLWGASKLVPLAYGINKLQISCIVEDEKVSVDLLQEQIEDLEDYVQSVDIAAFNKI